MEELMNFDWIWDDANELEDHATSSSNSSTELDNFHGSLDGAQQCTKNFVSTLNYYNTDILWANLKETCTREVKIWKRVYSLSDPHAREKGLQDTCFNSIEEFVCFMEVWNVFIPDGVFSASNHQAIVACLPSFVFICNLHFTGRKTVRTMNFFLEERLECYYHHLAKILPAYRLERPSEIRIEGSMTMFVNKAGLIEKIEFYLTEI